ncbi:hypothetical protein [Burkholderia ubonensis]|uniref:hypothetical protein n=1 Tax=Burkholderia ubonensis TaxID=101571 RepID=UPI000AF4F3C6|nr:hypothetical protein [Burkholderia ubonensis]
MSRYPYTEACDFIRRFSGTYNADIGCVLPSLSRCDASQIREAIAKAIGMDDAELAKKIADYARVLDGRTPASEKGES